jgi:hypothetical protein
LAFIILGDRRRAFAAVASCIDILISWELHKGARACAGQASICYLKSTGLTLGLFEGRAMWRTTMFAGAFILNATACEAADDQGRLGVSGDGSKSCNSYLSEDAVARVYFKDWVGGYVTAINELTPGVVDILGGTPLTGAMDWIDNYCRQHPADPFYVAAKAMTKSMPAK